MEKKSNLTQILLVIVLIGIAFYFGFSMNKNKEEYVPQDTSPVAEQESTDLSAVQIASMMGIDMEALDACMSSPEIAQKVQDQQDSGSKVGVTGTPGSFLLDASTKKAIQLGGAVPLATMTAELEKLKAGQGTVVDIDPITEEDFVKGDVNARYAVIEWSDYECPFCGRFQETAMQLVEENADVKWIYRQFPLDSLHPNTRVKSIAALCVGKIAGNDAFWAFSDALLFQ